MEAFTDFLTKDLQTIPIFKKIPNSIWTIYIRTFSKFLFEKFGESRYNGVIFVQFWNKPISCVVLYMYCDKRTTVGSNPLEIQITSIQM